MRNEDMNQHNFDTIWKNELAPIMENLQDEKNKARRQTGWIAFSLIVLVGVPGIVAEGAISIGMGVLIWIPLLVLSGWRIHALSNEYAADFKREVMGVLQQYTGLGWKIHRSNDDDAEPLRQQSRKAFKESKIATDYDNLLLGDVLITEYEDISISGAEVEATETRNAGKHSHTVDVFRGFFLTIPVAEKFTGRTYILTESDDTWKHGGVGTEGWFDDSLQETELEWGEFEDVFVVKTDDPQEAREVFTPDFMEVVYDWYASHDKQLRIAFIGGKIHVGVWSDVTFDPEVYGDMSDQRENVKGIYELLLFVESLVKQITYHNR